MKGKHSLKLTQLNARELSAMEKSTLKGGDADVNCCGCGCCWEGEPGGSDTNANAFANSSSNRDTVYCPVILCAQPGDDPGTWMDVGTCAPE